MRLLPLAGWQLPQKTGYLHSVQVNLREKVCILFSYSEKNGVDPGEECFNPEDIGRMHLALYEKDGTLLWDRRLPRGVLSGIWWFPVMPMDMNRDGDDEIYLINNRLGEVFSLNHRLLEKWDPRTGECVESWPWPIHNFDERMSLCYRWYIVGGYAHGEPVLVTSQGTYGAMHLQGWNDRHEKRWELDIPAEDPGPRASHVTPILDINGDGVDELLWGERVISLDTGKELFDFAPEYNGHSDAIIPFMNYTTGEMFLYTNREGGEAPGQYRVVTFRMDGSRAWGQIPDCGHIHHGWVANVLEDYGKVAMAMSQHTNLANPGLQDDIDGCYYFNAFTGEPVDFSLPVPGYQVTPLDLDGDGYHEFLVTEGERKGDILDRHGELITHFALEELLSRGKLWDEVPGEQFLTLEGGNRVTLWRDADAVDGEIITRRYSSPYLKYMQRKMTATGYNDLAAAGI